MFGDRKKSPEPELTATQQADYESRMGIDPYMAVRAEHGLLVNGVPFGLLYDYCINNGLETSGNIYATVIRDLKFKGKLWVMN